LLTPRISLLTSVKKMNRNRKIFIIATLVFVSIVALIAIDMARRTTAPWNKKKQIVRAFDVTTESDSIAVDTTK
jgi:hypothetical protein